jgi:hypothetical protein
MILWASPTQPTQPEENLVYFTHSAFVFHLLGPVDHLLVRDGQIQ